MMTKNIEKKSVHSGCMNKRCESKSSSDKFNDYTNSFL